MTSEVGVSYELVGEKRSLWSLPQIVDGSFPQSLTKACAQTQTHAYASNPALVMFPSKSTSQRNDNIALETLSQSDTTASVAALGPSPFPAS